MMCSSEQIDQSLRTILWVAKDPKRLMETTGLRSAYALTHAAGNAQADLNLR